MVICNEMVSQIRRFMQEIPVTPETLAMDTIAAIGPGNHYLTHRQTKAHYREQIWRPELISRKRYDAWEAEGELTLRQRARTKLLKIMETHQPQPLAPDVLQEVAALLKTAGAARTVS
ncbi:MAG: trimethylamine methyltransferase family protein [Desulfobacterales bacterium]